MSATEWWVSTATDLHRTSGRTKHHSQICRRSSCRSQLSALLIVAQGKDATEEYEPIHPPDTLEKYLDKSKHLGSVDMGTVEKEQKIEDPDEIERQDRIDRMPILEQCYNLMDFEAVARGVMKKTAWAYYSSGADDEIVRLRGSSQTSILTRVDNARESLCFPQDLVSSSRTGRRGKDRLLNHHARRQG